MTLQAAIEAELPYLRDEAAARMVDLFSIAFPTGGWMYDEDTRLTTQELAPLFETPGYIGTDKSAPREAQVGERTLVSIGRGIRIPWDSAAVPTGAVVTCIAVGAQTPPKLLDKQYLVMASEDATQKAYCNLAILEVLS